MYINAYSIYLVSYIDCINQRDIELIVAASNGTIATILIDWCGWVSWRKRGRERESKNGSSRSSCIEKIILIIQNRWIYEVASIFHFTLMEKQNTISKYLRTENCNNTAATNIENRSIAIFVFEWKWNKNLCYEFPICWTVDLWKHLLE